ERILAAAGAVPGVAVAAPQGAAAQDARAPGKVIAYSNYGAALAGYIVQRVSGEPFDRYISRHIFQPLHMTHSTFAQPLPRQLAPLMAKGYTTASADKPSPFENVEAAPAGASSATATDMAKFMMAYLNGGMYGGGTLLKRSTIRQMWTLQVRTAPGLTGFDLGFYDEDRNGQRIVGHAGDTDVFHSDLHLLPDDHAGIFMSFNSAGEKGASEDVRVQIFRAFLNRYYPYSARQLPRLATAKADAARVTGWYEASRREERALRLIYALGQTAVMAMPNGDLKVSMLVDSAGNPLVWREVGPLLYQRAGGQSLLEFTKGWDGRLYFATTGIVPVFVFQRVTGLQTTGSLKAVVPLFIAVLLISLLVRLGRWIARRKLHLEKGISRERKSLSLAARIGAVLFPGALVAWIVFLSNSAGLLSSAFVTEVSALYVLGVLAVIGGIAIIAEAAMRIRYGPGGWFVRTGEALVAVAAIYCMWLFIAFGLISFVTNF
ncbi:MAG: serine hydrolase domain-containing protein, partial [Candidatus Baltobacteraceae bacterium]